MAIITNLSDRLAGQGKSVRSTPPAPQTVTDNSPGLLTGQTPALGIPSMMSDPSIPGISLPGLGAPVGFQGKSGLNGIQNVQRDTFTQTALALQQDPLAASQAILFQSMQDPLTNAITRETNSLPGFLGSLNAQVGQAYKMMGNG